MGIAFSCPQCGKHFDVDAGLAGKKCRCKQCRHLFSIPIRQSAHRAAPAASPSVARYSDRPADPYGVYDAALPPHRGGFESAHAAPRRESEGDSPRWRLTSPWLTVWFTPRKTVRRILTKDREQGVLLLLFLYSINRCLSAFTIPPGLDRLMVGHILVIALFAGAIGVVLTYFIASPIFALAGQMLGGEGDTEDVRVAFAWSSVPSVAVIVFQVAAMAVFGRAMFLSSAERGGALPINQEINAAALPLQAWSLILFVAALAEVHRFSIAKSVGTIVLVGVGMFALIFGLGFFAVFLGILRV